MAEIKRKIIIIFKMKNHEPIVIYKYELRFLYCGGLEANVLFKRDSEVKNLHNKQPIYVFSEPSKKCKLNRMIASSPHPRNINWNFLHIS